MLHPRPLHFEVQYHFVEIGRISENINFLHKGSLFSSQLLKLRRFERTMFTTRSSRQLQLPYSSVLKGK
jgi:hypothetical protein